MGSRYKYYNLDEGAGIPVITTDMQAFYEAHTAYVDNRNERSKYTDFTTSARELYSTIKHREIEGFLTFEKAEEIREHIMDLLEEFSSDYF